MTTWKKETLNESNNTIAYSSEIAGIQVAFLNRPDFDTDVWKVRFDKEENESDPKILAITEEAFHRNLGFEKSIEVIEYLFIFIPYYIKKLENDFNNIPKFDEILSSNPEKLPKKEELLK